MVVGFSFAPDWLREWREFFFFTNHRVKLSTIYAVPDFFRDLASSKGVINIKKRVW